MKYFIIMISIIFTLSATCNNSFSICCSWNDRKACFNCPEGYSSGCITTKNTCNCDCAKNVSEMINKLSNGNLKLKDYIRNKFDLILKDTQIYDFHVVEILPDAKISIIITK